MARRLQCLSNLFISQYRHVILGTRSMTRFSKEITKVGAASGSNADLLLQHLKNCSSSNELLQEVQKHHNIMNSKHIVQSFHTLFWLHKNGRSGCSTKKIVQDPNFELLCSNLKQKAGSLEPYEALESLKVIVYMGVPSKSTIVQILLQILRHKINNLSIPQISFLDFLLHQVTPTPLVEALIIALPIVFETQLPTKMQRDDIVYLSEYLHYASRSQVSESCIELIVATAMKCKEPMNLATARSFVWSICDLQPDHFFEPLLNRALEALTLDVDKLSFDEIETTLSKIINRYSTKYNFYYNDKLFDICGNLIIKNDMGFERCIYVLNKFSIVGYTHQALLDYACKLCTDNPDLILFGDPKHVSIIITNLAHSDCRPANWNSLKESITNTVCFKNARKDFFWLKLATSLMVLDIHKQEVYENAFNLQVLDKILKRYYWNDFENLILLRQAIALYKPEFTNLLPPDSYINTVKNKIKPMLVDELSGALSKGLGGPQYLDSNIELDIGVTINYCIVLKNGYPLVIDKYISAIKKVELPEDCQTIAVLSLQPFAYSLNQRNSFRPTTRLLLKILESKGFITVPVSLETWKELLDYEKIPYLMQMIKEKMEDKRVHCSDHT